MAEQIVITDTIFDIYSRCREVVNELHHKNPFHSNSEKDLLLLTSIAYLRKFHEMTTDGVLKSELKQLISMIQKEVVPNSKTDVNDMKF